MSFAIIIFLSAPFWARIAADRACSAKGFEGPFYLCKAEIKYTVRPDALEWVDAYWDCQLRGEELVTILNKEQEDAVEKLVAPYNTNVDVANGFWTAASTKGDGSSINAFQWFTTGERVNSTYNKFSQGQPDNAKEKCVNLFKSNDQWWWNNVECNRKLKYVCQTKKNSCC